MKVLERVPSRFELHYLLANKLNHIGITSTKEALMQGIKKIVTKALGLGFHATYTDLYSSFFSLFGDGFKAYDP